MNEMGLRNHGQWTYELTSAVIDSEDHLRYTTYGMRARDHGGTVGAAYADVSTDMGKMEELIRKCNEGELSILHLEDVLLDFIE